MFDVKKMLVAILAVAVIGGLYLGYQALMFRNGIDVAKDTGGAALVSGMTLLMLKLMGGNNSNQ